MSGAAPIISRRSGKDVTMGIVNLLSPTAHRHRRSSNRPYDANGETKTKKESYNWLLSASAI
jgi:hypothetical protein